MMPFAIALVVVASLVMLICIVTAVHARSAADSLDQYIDVSGCDESFMRALDLVALKQRGSNITTAR